MEVHQLKALKDNYNYVIRTDDGFTFAIDPSAADPILSFVQRRDWGLDAILNTHHHYDHTDGNLELQRQFGCPVIAYHTDAHRTPGFTNSLIDEQVLPLGNVSAKVLHIPGHTLGQIAFWFERENLIFVGDTLFNYGCGRIFEGTHQMMFQSLQKLKGLPPDTRVYCGHEYTLRNLEVCALIAPEGPYVRLLQHARDELVEKGTTVPFVLSEQIRDNPFLTDDFQAFKRWREKRNAY